MTIDEEFLPDLWDLIKEYIPVKDRSAAAAHLISDLIDNGFEDEYVKMLSGCDNDMVEAVAEYFDDEEDWEEDD